MGAHSSVRKTLVKVWSDVGFIHDVAQSKFIIGPKEEDHPMENEVCCVF